MNPEPMQASFPAISECTGRGRLPRTPPIWFCIALFLSLAGCASPAKFQPASGTERYPPYEGEVSVLQNLPSADQYTRVGVVFVEGVLLTKEEDMVWKIKKKAAEKGADAVVMQSPMKVIENPDGSTTRKLAAWAIRLKR